MIMNQSSVQWQAGDLILDLYRVIGILGRDEFGEVYKVRHLGWNIDLAVKTPKPEMVAAVGGVENFERRIESWINLGQHPHLVGCYYTRRLESHPLVFVDYVAGGSLRQRIETRRLYANGTASSLRRILDIAIQYAWGLHYAHEQGLIHQNATPDNAMMTPDGVVKVSDFGLGWAQVAYCAPEQAQQGTITPRTDVWGWGLTLLEMLLGRRTWASGTLASQALAHYLETGGKDAQIPMPAQMAELLKHCFQENPEQRPANLREVAIELQSLYQQVVGSTYPRQEPNIPRETACTLNNHAVALWDLGRPEESLRLWDQALAIQPHHQESIYNRGIVLWRSGRIADDNTLLRQLDASRTQADDWTVDYLLSLVHLERGDYQTALRLLESIQARGTQQDDIEAMIALVRERLPYSRQLLPEFGDRAAALRNTPYMITAIALSPTGHYALSGGDDQTIRFWEVASGKSWVFRGHQGRVSSVTFSPDGSNVLSGSADKTVKLWNLASTSHLHTFGGREERASGLRRFLGGGSNQSQKDAHTSLINAIAISPDGRYVLSGSDDRTIKLWEVATGKCLRTFKGHRERVFAVVFSPDRQHILSASDDQSIRLWSIATGGVVRTLDGHQRLTSIALSPNGQFVLAGDSPVRMWDIMSGQVVRTFEGHESEVKAVAFSPDGRSILSGADDSRLKLWDIATGRCLRTFEGHESGIHSIAVSQDGRYVLSTDGSVMKLWAVHCTTPPTYAPLRLSHLPMPDVVITGDRMYEQELAQAQAALSQGDAVAAASRIRRARSQSGYNRAMEAVQAWLNLYPYLPRQAFNGAWEQIAYTRHMDVIGTVAFSPDGNQALSGGADTTLKLWDTASDRCLLSFEGHRGSVEAVTFSPDGRYALSGSTDTTLKLWDVSTGDCLRTFEGHGGAVHAVAVAPKGRYALSGSADGILKLWDMTTGHCLRTFTRHRDRVTAVTLSPDGRYALSGSLDKTLKLWDLTTGETLRTFEGHIAAIHSIAMSLDGRYALSGSDDQTLKLWDVNTSDCLRTFSGHSAAIHAVAFSADGHYALSGSDDQSLKLWDVNTGDCLRTLTGHSAAIQAVAFSLDSRYALSGGTDRTLKLWILDWELADRESTQWDEGARPYLDVFLALHTPRAATLPTNRQPSEQEVAQALRPQGTPVWTDADLSNLMQTLRYAGYGWLRPEGVRQQLVTLTRGLIHQTVVQPVAKQAVDATVFPTGFAIDNPTVFPTEFIEAETAAKVILTVTEGTLKGEEYTFRDRTICIIGRAKDCHLQLPSDENHKTVSRYHCLLDIDPPTIRIRDLGSLHGTYVNGQIIGRRKPNQSPEEGVQMNSPGIDLTMGDEIKLGKTVFKVRIDAPNADRERTIATSFATAIGDQTALFDRRDLNQSDAPVANGSHPQNLSIDGYTPLRQLESGEFSEVYLARDSQNNQLVTLKLLRTEKGPQSAAIETLLQDVESLRGLQHPNIIQLLNSGYSNGALFFAQDYCEGNTVAELIQRRGGRLSVEEAVSIAAQVLEGLEYAHDAEVPLTRANGRFAQGRGFIHCNLNPATILLATSQTAQVAKIADYGLARSLDQAGLRNQSTSTATNPSAFMPRQQAVDFKYIRPDIDIWAAAACLYYMLTGAYPRDFGDRDPYLVLLQTEPIAIRDRDASIPKQLAELIDLALVDAPEIFFKNATAFKRALKSIA
ncbi:MAG: protein kinase [Cyanobacteria bacterium CRU_2_1]|nr:protein kinase [Cyanobacteria bacterium RU_5_0]NJR61364.1 protein kinase [Cyanobacteria bacterium CRU_2_1]